MNERIGTLLNRSGGEFYEGFLGSPNTIKFTEEELATFVDLIVRECTNMLPEDSIRNKDGVHMFYAIREHFGVSPIGR